MLLRLNNNDGLGEVLSPIKNGEEGITSYFIIVLSKQEHYYCNSSKIAGCRGDVCMNRNMYFELFNRTSKWQDARKRKCILTCPNECKYCTTAE